MNNFTPENNFIDPLKNPSAPISYSPQFAAGSIFAPAFINKERRQPKKTIVFDFDETIRGWDDNTEVGFLRRNLRPLLSSLIANYRLVIWSASNRPSIQQTLNRYPELENYFALIISAENFNFHFLSEPEQQELKTIDETYYQDLVKTSAPIEAKTGRSLKRMPKNISLFHYSLIIDDDPQITAEAAKYAFKAFRIFPYKYDSPGYKDLVPAELVDDIEADFTDNMHNRIVDLIENKPMPEEKLYLIED